MPRAAKLGRLKGYWYTRAGNPSGVYFGKVGEVSHADARKRFRKYLASLDEGKLQQVLPALSVAEVCDAHLKWVRVERSEALFKQRRSFLNHWCRHKVDELRSQRLPGHGKMVGYLRATVVSRGHVEEYLTSRRTQPSERTGRPLSDKGIRAVISSWLKACWNWAADSVEDGGGGFFEDSHRPFAKLESRLTWCRKTCQRRTCQRRKKSNASFVGPRSSRLWYVVPTEPVPGRTRRLARLNGRRTRNPR